MTKQLGGGGLFQKTLKQPISCSGVGLHSGNRVHMRIAPAPADSGISFLRTDRPVVEAEIPARWSNVKDTRLCTVVGNDSGAVVGTVEHLMAALRGCEIDNAVVEIDSAEVPVVDGSAEPFVFLLECAGTEQQVAPRRGIRILKPVKVGDRTKSALLTPGAVSSFSFDIEFDSRAIARQYGEFTLYNGTFRDDLCRARTFGFLHEVDHLRKLGLARGGSLENAIVIDGDRVLNRDGLRYGDEFVRHKILDSIGDLFLAGSPIIGHYHGTRAGHALNNQLLHALFADAGAYRIEALTAADIGPAPWRNDERLVANG